MTMVQQGQKDKTRPAQGALTLAVPSAATRSYEQVNLKSVSKQKKKKKRKNESV